MRIVVVGLMGAIGGSPYAKPDKLRWRYARPTFSPPAQKDFTIKSPFCQELTAFCDRMDLWTVCDRCAGSALTRCYTLPRFSTRYRCAAHTAGRKQAPPAHSIASVKHGTSRKPSAQAPQGRTPSAQRWLVVTSPAPCRCPPTGY